MFWKLLEKGVNSLHAQIVVCDLIVNKGKEIYSTLLTPGQMRTHVPAPSSCEGENKVSNLSSFKIPPNLRPGFVHSREKCINLMEKGISKHFSELFDLGF